MMKDFYDVCEFFKNIHLYFAAFILFCGPIIIVIALIVLMIIEGCTRKDIMVTPEQQIEINQRHAVEYRKQQIKERTLDNQRRAIIELKARGY